MFGGCTLVSNHIQEINGNIEFQLKKPDGAQISYMKDLSNAFGPEYSRMIMDKDCNIVSMGPIEAAEFDDAYAFA